MEEQCARGEANSLPSETWNIEMLEAMNFASIKQSQKSSNQYFEIFQFHEYEGQGFLLNTRPAYLEDNFTRLHVSTPIYLLKSATGVFHTMHPRSNQVSKDVPL
jgi:hypothetical protein